MRQAHIFYKDQLAGYLRMCKLVIFSTILGLYLHFGK